MKIVTRIVVLILFIILIGAVGSGFTARRTSACDGLTQAVDCYDAASLSYSPSNPGPGDYVYINVVIDATVSNAPGFSDTLYVDGQVVETNEVYYNGCEINVAYYYTCEGQQYPVFMIIPGRSCDGSSTGILGGLVAVGELKEAIEMLLDTYISNPKPSWSDWFFTWGKNKFIGGVGNTGNWVLDQAYDVSNPKTFVILGCWRFINHYFFLSTPEGNPKGVCGALKDTFWDLSGTVIEKTMGGYFETWKISRSS